MLLGVISDTHDRLSTIDLAIAFFVEQKVQYIIHCGDWKTLDTLQYFLDAAEKVELPVYGVLGNNDKETEEMLSLADTSSGTILIKEGILEATIDGKRCAIYHGHHTPTLRRFMNSTAYDIIFLGHTHKPCIDFSNKTLVVNPGSVAFAIPRSKEWKPTVAIVDTATLSSEIVELI